MIQEQDNVIKGNVLQENGHVQVILATGLVLATADIGQIVRMNVICVLTVATLQQENV